MSSPRTISRMPESSAAEQLHVQPTGINKNRLTTGTLLLMAIISVGQVNTGIIANDSLNARQTRTPDATGIRADP